MHRILFKHYQIIQFKWTQGHWSVKNIKPTSTGESQEVRIKLRINDNGLILVTSANIVEKKAIKEPETPPTAENAVPNPENGSNMDTTEVSVC